ncbi:MAG: aldo/keto reductase [Candidatus Latescibacterota bacterium]|nr:aldo/keto reductase [Candidatus Latescibacterota bacterium]
MRTVQLGSTDLHVSAIAYGGMSLTGDRAEEGIAAVAAAFEQGINFFDTADVYGRGEAESILGRRSKRQASTAMTW